MADTTNTSKNSDPQRWYTVRQAAKYLQVSEPTIFRWMKEGKLTFYKIGGATRFSQKSLDAVISKNTSVMEAQQLVGKCVVCGHDMLVEGRVQGNGRLYFKPAKSKFWVLHEAMVATNARVCCACGYVHFFADTSKLEKLKPAKIQADGED